MTLSGKPQCHCHGVTVTGKLVPVVIMITQQSVNIERRRRASDSLALAATVAESDH